MDFNGGRGRLADVGKAPWRGQAGSFWLLWLASGTWFMGIKRNLDLEK
jgi:hypothetical protein